MGKFFRVLGKHQFSHSSYSKFSLFHLTSGMLEHPKDQATVKQNKTKTSTKTSALHWHSLTSSPACSVGHHNTKKDISAVRECPKESTEDGEGP